MAGHDPSCPRVEVFMTEEKALWAEWEHNDDSDHGSSSEGILLLTLLSAWAMSNVEAGPSGRDLSAKDVKTEDLKFVDTQKDLRWDVFVKLSLKEASFVYVLKATVAPYASGLTSNSCSKQRYQKVRKCFQL